jgi:hypothetical protein
MFDKVTYKKNRQSGARGQGSYPSLIIGIDTTPPTSARGLGLRKKKSATKHSKFNTAAWTAHKLAVAIKVKAREAVAKERSAVRRAAREQMA